MSRFSVVIFGRIAYHVSMPPMSGSDLKARREALGLDQCALADKLGVHKRTISKWERGVHAIPEMVTLAFQVLEASKPKRRTRPAAQQQEDGE